MPTYCVQARIKIVDKHNKTWECVQTTKREDLDIAMQVVLLRLVTSFVEKLASGVLPAPPHMPHIDVLIKTSPLPPNKVSLSEMFGH